MTLTDKANAVAVAIGPLGSPSKKLVLYRDALIHAAEMDRLPAGAELREARQSNTLSWARHRLSKLSVEDRALVEACGGGLNGA